MSETPPEGVLGGTPADGHQFHLSVKIGGSYRVGSGPHQDAPDDGLEPWTLTVRAWSLRAALRAAAEAPLDAWDPHYPTGED